jgi:hypothetical protein
MRRGSALRTAALCAAILAPVGAAGGERTVPDPLSWRPGMPASAILAEFERARWRPVRRGDRAWLVEAPLVRELFVPQRALLELDGSERLRAVTLQLLPDPAGDPRAALELYADARALLLRRLGTPSWSQEEGGAVGASASALFAGRVVRCVQWDGEVGVRLGIPRSPSGELRLELQLAAPPLGAARGYWGRDF